MTVRRFLNFAPILVSITLIVSCSEAQEENAATIDDVAEDYVKLALEIGLYDDDFVDAYYGPVEWKPQDVSDSAREFPYEELKWKAMGLLHDMEQLEIEGFDSLGTLRYKFIHNQLIALRTKLDMIAGDIPPFDVESRALYDAVSPDFEQGYFDDLLTELDYLLPGSGSISTRYEQFSAQFVIAPDKVDTVFRTAIKEARDRTASHISLPASENFTLEYVTNQPWSGYNWYKGDAYSLIQINTDLPISIDRAIDLACHEGYPGHHVYNVMLEKRLVKEKKWVEFTIYPLFSPQSLIAEGTANYGIEVAFPGSERRTYEKEILFPLAGIDPGLVDTYYDIQEIRRKLNYAGNEAARQYLNGQITRQEAADLLEKYLLYSPERALQRTEFIDKYRSYVINYNYGLDLVRNYVLSRGGTDGNPELRWEIFQTLLSNPITASTLLQNTADASFP